MGNQESSCATCEFFDNRLWSIGDVSTFLAVSVSTIRDWVYKRKIPYIKVGRHIRFRPSDIEIWLKNGGNNGDK